LAGFLFALDHDRQAPHDRAAHTRVIYEIHERKPATARGPIGARRLASN
jgi:hypothetical protein